MQIVERQKTEKIYIAQDGKEFEYESECRKYEDLLLCEKSIEGIPCVNCNYQEWGRWYYISSQEEFEALKSYIQKALQHNTATQFIGEYNNDWISYDIFCQNNFPDQCKFVSFQEIKKEFKKLEQTLKGGFVE
ncbi:MAG TPA: hypothetical protein DDZ91_12155 [Firmicutes bacterium]|jgi:hypothetical protein|nr:hypothetical protein [Bacillota bacterium]